MKTKLEEEIKPTGDGARSERQEPAYVRQLDMQIAERVMGWVWYAHDGESVLVPPALPRWHDFSWMRRMIVPEPQGTVRALTALDFRAGLSLPNYSSDIRDAMRVVEKLGSRGYSFACTIYQGHLPHASFCKGTAASSRNAEATTLPEAVCRAALALVDGPQNQETK